VKRGMRCSARNWFLRVPNPSNANNERIVNSDGSHNNNNANNGNGAVADYDSKMPRTVSSSPGTDERGICFARNAFPSLKR